MKTPINNPASTFYNLLLQLPQSHPKSCKLLLDLVQAGMPEILAAQQLVFGARSKLGDGGDVQPLQRLAAANREFQIDDLLVENLGSDVADDDGRPADRGTALALLGRLAQPQSLGGQQALDLIQTCLAEVLVAQQFLLAGAQQVAKALDVHLLETIAAAHRKLEIGDRDVEYRVAPIAASLGVFIVEHRPRRLDVLHV